MDPKTEMALRRHWGSLHGRARQRGSIAPAKRKVWIDNDARRVQNIAGCFQERNRDLNADEILAFDEGMRLVDYWKSERSTGGRQVPPEQAGGVEDERRSRRGADPEMRYVTEDGRESTVGALGGVPT